MQKLKQTGIILFALIGLIASSGVALADSHDDQVEEKEDTLFNYAYDLANQIFLWNLSDVEESSYDCTLETEDDTVTYTATYGDVSADGVIPVVSLTSGEGPATFESRTEGEDLAPYPAGDGECALTGASVTGPNGHVNHGMFMKLFNSLWEGPGRGCINRHLAQSDLGKDDQQVNAGDAEDVTISDTSDPLSFTTVLADCERGQNDEENGESNGNANANANANANGKGQGNNGSPGNSGNAPGRNK